MRERNRSPPKPLTIEQGETFEIEKDFTGLSLKKGRKGCIERCCQ